MVAVTEKDNEEAFKILNTFPKLDPEVISKTLYEANNVESSESLTVLITGMRKLLLHLFNILNFTYMIFTYFDPKTQHNIVECQVKTFKIFCEH